MQSRRLGLIWLDMAWWSLESTKQLNGTCHVQRQSPWFLVSRARKILPVLSQLWCLYEPTISKVYHNKSNWVNFWIQLDSTILYIQVKKYMQNQSAIHGMLRLPLRLAWASVPPGEASEFDQKKQRGHQTWGSVQSRFAFQSANEPK